MLNRVCIMGRLGSNPELKSTQASFVTSFSIAVTRNYKSKDGTYPADWIDIVAWGSTAEFICKYFVKGSLIAIEGRLQARNWTDKNGSVRKSTEVIADSAFFAERKASGQDARQYALAPAPAPAAPAQNYQQSSSLPEMEELTDDDDELPF